LGALVHPTASGEARAPLFLLPVRIEGGAGKKPYTILIDGDEIAAPNHCLVQWLRVNHSVRIPELETPTADAGPMKRRLVVDGRERPMRELARLAGTLPA
jgi:hypothetical protein